jgi:hypothetical protein
MAQTAFVYNLIYIIPVGIVGIILIYKGNKLRKAKLLEIENLKKR